MSPHQTKRINQYYLDHLETGELVHWLVHSFSPQRFLNGMDVVQYACSLIVKRCPADLASEFIARLWAIHSVYITCIDKNLIVSPNVSYRKITFKEAANAN